MSELTGPPQHSTLDPTARVSQARGLSLNALALLTASLLPPAAGFLIVAYIGRHLGAVVFGEYMVAYSWYFLLTPVANLGLPSFLIRRLSRLRSPFGPFVARSLVLIFVSGTLCGLAMWIGAVAVGHSAATMDAILLLASTMGLTSSVPVLHGVLVSQERAGVVLLSEAVESVFRVVTSLLLIRLGYGVVWLVGAFVVSRLLSVSVCLLFLRRYGHIGWQTGERAWFSTARVLRETLPFAGIAWLNVAYWRIGTLVLARIQGEAAVGVYSAANKLFQILQFVPESVLLALFPRLSRRFVRARPAFENLVELGVRYLLAGSILPALLMTLAARPALQFTYRLPVFQEAVPVLCILNWALLFYATRRLFVRLMMATDLERPLVGLLAVGTAVGVALNVLLVQQFGAAGLAVATMLNLAGLSGLLGWFVFRHLALSPKVLDWRRLAGIGLASGLAAGIGFGLQRLSWLAAVAGSTVGYVAVILISRAISLEEVGLPAWRRPARRETGVGKDAQCTQPEESNVADRFVEEVHG